MRIIDVEVGLSGALTHMISGSVGHWDRELGTHLGTQRASLHCSDQEPFSWVSSAPEDAFS